jgi:glycerol-3-phosphate acyltransferase PlsX
MSGDGGVATALQGASGALEADPDLRLTLVITHEHRDLLVRHGLDDHPRVRVAPARSTLPMDAGAARALRNGSGSSLQVCLEQVASGADAAAVSAGNTAALMALGRQLLGMLPGIERPALMAALPSATRPVWVLDLGANIGVNAQRLLEFAQLGHTAVRVSSGRSPRIGLLNIGREPGKGPDVVREAARLIDADSRLDYVGFVEADRVFEGEVDLVVCDGFAGNVLLKGAEGTVRMIFDRLEREFRGPLRWLARRRVERLYDKLDPARHNGAPLLGIDGVVIKSHGGACRRGFASAIALAALEARRGLTAELADALWASD